MLADRDIVRTELEPTHAPHKGGTLMKTARLASLPVLLIVGGFAFPVFAGTLATFKGGIGVMPVSSGQGTASTATTVNRNIVRGVQPAGQLWVIRELEAEVKTNGTIEVKGKGLVLGGGNNIGRATGQSVFATLMCGDQATLTEHHSDLTGVPLDANGDFTIDDVLAPPPPEMCVSPVLLIRNAANFGWFAAGILKSDDGDE
jgi:hypothetical protein